MSPVDTTPNGCYWAQHKLRYLPIRIEITRDHWGRTVVTHLGPGSIVDNSDIGQVMAPLVDNAVLWPAEPPLCRP